MNTPNDEPGDEVASAYRRASESQAGRPAGATRAAILDEARAAAARRTPAANDSRYVWRAAAGIAVLGVALLLWRQADRHVAPDLTIRAPATSSGKVAVDSTSAAPAATPAPPDAEPAAAAPVVSAKDERSAAPKAQAARAPEAPPARMDAADTGAAATAAESPQLASANGAPAARVAPRREAPDYRLLVQREFPEEWNSTDAPPTLWVVLDGQGNVLRKGSMTPGATVTADQPFESQRPWTMISVKTASGRVLPLAVMTIN